MLIFFVQSELLPIDCGFDLFCLLVCSRVMHLTLEYYFMKLWVQILCVAIYLSVLKKNIIMIYEIYNKSNLEIEHW